MSSCCTSEKNFPYYIFLIYFTSRSKINFALWICSLNLTASTGLESLKPQISILNVDQLVNTLMFYYTTRLHDRFSCVQTKQC